MSYTPSSKTNTTNHRRTASAQHRRRESQLRNVINSSMSSNSQHSESSDSMTESEEHEMDAVQHRGHLDDDEETGLTSDLRRQRSRRKRRNTDLDQRIAFSGDSMTAMKEQSLEEASLTRRTLLYRILLNVLFIALWYTFSISISVYNKWMFSAAPPEGDPTNRPDGSPLKQAVVFPFPLFTTCIHMLVQFSLASLILYFIPRLRPQHPAHLLTSESGEKPPIMSRFFYLTRIGPCGAATGLDIGLGNMSLKFISLTFYTMCKSSVLGFVLLFAFLFRLEKPSWRLFAIITTMTMGVLLMVAGEVSFSLLGFILVMSAAASSGFRWSLTQILLLRNPATSNPFSSIFFLAPIMFVTLLIIAVPVEGLPELRDAFYNLSNVHGTGMSILILLFPGVLAFCMTASEFALLQRTSVVTLSIAGIFKEVLTISTASMVFGDEKLTPINLAGLVITILTIAYYNFVKISRMQEEAKLEAQMAVHGAAQDGGDRQAYAPVLSADPDVSSAGMGRQSTSDMIRNSLSISTSGDYAKALKKVRPDETPRISPVKRPEDLD